MKTSITIILVLALLPSLASALTIRVPMDQPTIQEAYEAAVSGDSIVVACGTYFEHGILAKAGVVLRSETGQADCVTVDGERLGVVLKIGPFYQLVGDFRIEGLTFAHGDTAGVWDFITSSGVPRIYYESCNFFDNNGSGLESGGEGALRRGSRSSMYVSNCAIENNSGTGVAGSFIRSRVFTNCRISGNGDDGTHLGTFYSYLEFYDCTISDNGGYGLNLGNVHNNNIIHRCTIENNSAGGILNRAAEAPLEIKDCHILRNGGNGIEKSDRHIVYLSLTGGTIIGNQGHGILFNSDDPNSDICGDSNSSSAVITDCEISDNLMNGIYQGPAIVRKRLQLTGCQIIGNGIDGVGINFNCPGQANKFSFTNTTIAENGRHGLNSKTGIPCEVTNSLIAFNHGDGIYISDGVTPLMIGSDIYGNTGGDWVGDIAPQIDAPGNFSADPCFCGGGYTVAADSPCLPENHPWEWNTLVGALGMGCTGGMCNGPVMIEPTTWGSIKGLYR